MDNIETKLKNKINETAAPRSIFEKTMSSVTKDDFARNYIVKDELPSVKSSSYIIFAKRFAYVSAPLLVLASYMLFIGIDNKHIVADDGLKILSINKIDKDVKAGEAYISESEYIDSIISDIVSEAEKDSSFAINDSFDDSFIKNELDNSLIITNKYEEII